jgi:hypothetical protein
MKLSEFKGVATVLGTPRNVEFDGSKLTIQFNWHDGGKGIAGREGADTFDATKEALAALAALDNPSFKVHVSIDGVKASEIAVTTEALAPKTADRPAAAQEPAKAEPEAAKAADAPKEKKARTSAKEKAAAEATKPAEAPTAKAEPEPAKEPAKEEAKPAAAKEEPKPGWDLAGDGKGDDPEDRLDFDIDGELPKELVEAGRIKQVIVFLQDRGFRTQEQLEDACKRIKDRVPMLASTGSNLSDRIRVALEVLRSD